MALRDKRLEAMRQITKPVLHSEPMMTWVLIDAETERCLGVYDSEEKADEAQAQVWEEYQIDTMVEEMVMNDTMGHYGTAWARR